MMQKFFGVDQDFALTNRIKFMLDRLVFCQPIILECCFEQFMERLVYPMIFC